MSDKFYQDSRRQAELAERSFAEAIFGCPFTVRVYARHGNVARGTVMLADKDGYQVHTAYLISDKKGAVVIGKVIGVLVERTGGAVSVVLTDEESQRVWTQNEIAEAVDYWECQNGLRIWCRREKSCGAVVFTGEGSGLRYLLIRMNLGHCGLPKGHVEKYESERETALREVREETGVSITLIDGFRETVEYSLSSRIRKESVYFLGRFDGSGVVIQESEVSAYRLCPYEEARGLITFDNDRAILDAAHRFLTGAS